MNIINFDKTTVVSSALFYCCCARYTYLHLGRVLKSYPGSATTSSNPQRKLQYPIPLSAMKHAALSFILGLLALICAANGWCVPLGQRCGFDNRECCSGSICHKYGKHCVKPSPPPKPTSVRRKECMAKCNAMFLPSWN